MQLAIGLAVHRRGSEVRKFGLAPIETGSCQQQHDRSGHGDGAVNKARGLQTAQPGPEVVLGPYDSYGGSQDRRFQLRRRLDLFQCIEAAQQMRDTRHQRRANRASVHMLIESAPFRGVQQPVEVVAQACFGLFASPGHCPAPPLAPKLLTTGFMPGALPFVAESLPIRCARD